MSHHRLPRFLLSRPMQCYGHLISLLAFTWPLAADTNPFKGLQIVVVHIGSFLLLIVPWAFAIAVLISALLWVFSGGNHQRAAAAKQWFFRAIIGLAIIAGYNIFRTVVRALAAGDTVFGSSSGFFLPWPNLF